MELSSNLKLNLINKLFLLPNNFILSDIVEEKESSEYEAFDTRLDNYKIKFRTAKITPTKVGQFVTFWKRSLAGPIEPFNILDDYDFYSVIVEAEENLGIFIFPKKNLSEKNILTTGSKEGKRAFRVYPPWDKTIASQAQKTQKWQLEYFLDLTDKNNFDIERFKKLLNSKGSE